MTKDDFYTELAPLYRQFWPRVSEVEKRAHSDDRHAVLGTFYPQTIRRAVEACLATETKMPSTATLRAACMEVIAKARAAKALNAPQKQEVDSDSCPCGCGGRRWVQQFAGGPREYRTESGDPFTIDGRDHMACLARKHDLPHGKPLYNDHRGIGVYPHYEATEYAQISSAQMRALPSWTDK